MVKQILLFARGSEGEQQLVDIAQLLGEVVKLARDTFPKNVSVHAAAIEAEAVRGNPTQLHQVLLNLCVNARDAMPQGGQLALSARTQEVEAESAERDADARAGRYVRLSVSDTGEGIPEQLRERIFEPFFTTKPLGQGTGLGLSTSLAIVKNHRGFLRLVSGAGRGTTFHVFLPVAEEAAAGALPLDVADAAGGNGETVLLVDDEEMILDLARDTCCARGTAGTPCRS
jgi:signal transduction histidine kinase